MKQATIGMIALLFVTFMVMPVMAQVEGDYRTRNSGNWNNAQNWHRYSGTAWVNVATPPTGSETITVQPTDSISVTVSVSITGRLINQGRVTDGGLLTIADGGVYQHDRDSGDMPLATWAEGSTFHLTGTTGTAPANRNQAYHHIILDTPGLTSNRDLSLNDVTIGGDIIIRDTGSARWQLTSAPGGGSASITILGDVIHEAGQFTVQGTGNANTTFVVDHYGDIVVTGGNFSISRGSQPFGTTTWNLHGGNFSMENATTQNSTNPPTGAAFVFLSGETQTLTLGSGNTLTALPIEVRDGTTLDMGSSRLAGNGPFLLEEGSILGTALPGGITPIFADVTSTFLELQEGSGYLFNGTEAQVTSGRMPTTVGDLIINNEAGVTLSQETTINGVLRLQAGEFDNTIPFELGPEGSISYEGGSLAHAVSVDPESGLPTTFFVEQNYPNPFNPTTTVRFGLPSASHVTVGVYNVQGQLVMTLVNGQMNVGVHEIPVNMDGLSSGVYLYRIQTDQTTITRQMVLIK
jgi:hypothetical protein